jgi:MYXO-CTERM domain-containing protein
VVHLDVQRVILGLITVCALAPRAHGANVVSTTTPYSGITHMVYEEQAIPARIHVVVVDLSSSELSLIATSEDKRGRTLSSFSTASTAQVVINGDYFSPVDYSTAGLAMGAAALWSGSTDDSANGFVSFDLNGARNNVAISAPAEVVAGADLPTGTQGVVGGRPMLVRAGIPESGFDCTDVVAMPCERAPRTAVAVSGDGNTMWLVVVDGWQQASLGMTAGELGNFLKTLGAHDALMLDGGGASALYIAGESGIVSSPSDGVERIVANHLGVRFGALPSGTMVGLVRERDIFDDTANLDGVTVTLDDGQQTTTGPDGRYSFQVPPRYVCATASKAGYHSNTLCKQVESGVITYNSIPLFPNSDFVDAAPGTPDAGPMDAQGPIPDSGPFADSGSNAGADGGNGGGGGGGCRSAGGGAPGWLAIMGLALLCVRRRRRRAP